MINFIFSTGVLYLQYTVDFHTGPGPGIRAAFVNIFVANISVLLAAICEIIRSRTFCDIR